MYVFWDDEVSCLSSLLGKASERSPKPLSEDALLYFDVITRAILGADEQSMRVRLSVRSPDIIIALEFIIHRTTMKVIHLHLTFQSMHHEYLIP